MKLIQSFVGLNNDWITQFSSVLIADTIHTFFVIVDALIQAYRKLAKMAKHKLTDINIPNVVFVGWDGTVWRTPANGNPRQNLGRGNVSRVHRGEFFSPGVD